MKKETIVDLQKEYFGQIDHLDLDLIVAHILKKPREFVLAHPEYKLPPLKIENLKLKIARRMRAEPLAYILGYKEFYGLDFKVTPATLIPRPETELLIEETLKLLQTTSHKPQAIVDIGTGSGNIIIALAKNIPANNHFLAVDISNEALKIAKHNAKANQVDKKIKFFHGNLLDPITKKISNLKPQISNLVITANLPYLSQEIYNATLPNVKKFEPKSALYSPQEGLGHYAKLFEQIKLLRTTNQKLQTTIVLEISPEQKIKLPRLIKKYLAAAKIEFHKDLAGKWRVCKIKI